MGDEPCVVAIVLEGAVEYLSSNGEVAVRFDSALLKQAYADACRRQGLGAGLLA